jgi:hypothetical protein
MALTPRPVSGTKFYVSATAPATLTEAGYTALTWTEVPGMENVPGFGDSYEIGTFNSVADGQYQYRSTRVAKTITTNMLDDLTNAGQVIMKAAFDAGLGTSAELISFKREDAAGRGQCARGFVSDFTLADGGSGDLQMRTVTIATIVGTTVEIS